MQPAAAYLLSCPNSSHYPAAAPLNQWTHIAHSRSVHHPDVRQLFRYLSVRTADQHRCNAAGRRYPAACKSVSYLLLWGCHCQDVNKTEVCWQEPSSLSAH